MEHGIPGLHRDKEEYTVCNTIHPPLMCAQELNIRSEESHTKIEGERTGEMDPPSHMLLPGDHERAPLIRVTLNREHEKIPKSNTKREAAALKISPATKENSTAP
ncbi:hypothetical protein NC652_016836 [Populus alba x Populus x berolinensis]|nr:hypothetical protein NC652_016836 [Populus alba x Populus x berolinensis]